MVRERNGEEGEAQIGLLILGKGRGHKTTSGSDRRPPHGKRAEPSFYPTEQPGQPARQPEPSSPIPDF